MAIGVPYDSVDARLIAASITSLMTATAYHRSAVLAAHLGPYDGYADNAEAHQQVVERHAMAHAGLPAGHRATSPIIAAASLMWQQALRLGDRHGWRNCHVSMIAPTGTVSIMMDCATSGIEPDFSLVKTKKLLSGGTLRFTNPAVEASLVGLGYSPGERQEILQYIDTQGSISGAPNLSPDQYSIFATAGGHPTVSTDGHLAMVAAVQPFLSGGVSKTINVRSDAAVADVEEIFIAAWQLGLKAVSVYRNGSKPGQPLSSPVQ
jgi:ribonucleoside-diphosphate reductase alpha chain